MLMPSHAKAVKPFRDPLPLFSKHGVEAQLDAMFSNHVTLRSGGYLVINPTEALVSIDVNSGRATREHNIEDTALKTNLEAAEEISRQLRLRDLAGLVVIDFIDMEEKRNNRAVEKRLNECLKNDRARIQVGRISLFGLLEMSRQRIRTGVLESSSISCPHCAGTGFIRATPSVALHILRSVEETLIKSASHNVVIRTRSEVALYILNQKRAHLREFEVKFGVEILVIVDDSLSAAVNFAIERGEPAPNGGLYIPAPSAFQAEEVVAPVVETEDVVEEEESEEEVVQENVQEARDGGHSHDSSDDGHENGRKRRRRRRRGRGRNGEREGTSGERVHHHSEQPSEDPVSSDEVMIEVADEETAADIDNSHEERASRQRRSRRGGRGRGRNEPLQADAMTDQASIDSVISEISVSDLEPTVESSEAVEEQPKKGRSRSRKPVKTEKVEEIEVSASDEASETEKPKRRRKSTKSSEGNDGVSIAAEAVKEKAPKRTTRKPAASKAAKANESAKETVSVEKKQDTENKPEIVIPAPMSAMEPVSVVLTPADPDRPKRAGWWSRGAK